MHRKFKRRRTVTVLAALSVALVCAAPAPAQYASDFESLMASPVGVILTGQDGYYLPPGTSSVDHLAYDYVGNALGVASNPNGGAQFIGGVGPAANFFARAQRDIPYGSGTGVWTAGTDINVHRR